MLSKSQNSRLRNTQRSEEDAHGYHHASHNCPCHSVAWRRRLVRPWTLVLDAADFKLARRCNAAALSSVTDAAKSAATPSEEEKMTVMDVPLVADVAAMPMPFVAPKKWKATVKRAPAKTPPKKAPQKRRLRKPPRSLQSNPLLNNQRRRLSIHPRKKRNQLPSGRLLGRRRLGRKRKQIDRS
jgi:hypothetical protein